METIAIQGGEGSYHDQVADKYFGATYQPLYCATFEQVFKAVEQGQAGSGLVASGNTIFGVIEEVHELLRGHEAQVYVADQTGMPIHHCLIGLPGATLGNITTVHSQDVALAQCKRFLQARLPQAQQIAEADTAGSVRLIKEARDKTAAAIASKPAAELYGMQVLHESVEDNPGNYTSFLIIRKK